jgi:hypothetical protein
MPPECPASSSGEPTVPDVGDPSTPVTSSRMKLRSMTPFDDVSEVKCMVLPSGSPCSGAPGDTYVYRSTVNTSGHGDSVVVVAEDFGETRVGQVLPGQLHRPDEAAIIDMQRGLKICEIVPPGGSDS